MNEKLRKHVDILFAAAPKNQKAAEIKEELLTSLNDKYNDLLSNGYDSTAAFHIALSGIGDIDELFRECGMRPDAATSTPSDAPSSMSIPISSLLPEKVSRMLILLGLAVGVLLLVGNVPVHSSFLPRNLSLLIVGVLIFYAVAPFFIGQTVMSKILISLIYFAFAFGILSLGTEIEPQVISLFGIYRLNFFWPLCWVISGMFFICAFVSLFMKAPLPTERDCTPAAPSVFIKPKPSRMPMLLGAAFALIVVGPVLSFICFANPAEGFAFILLCWGVAGSILVYAIASFFARRNR